jgi:tetratricopeptide (TPR) repeat protein
MCGGEIIPEGNASYGTCDSCGGTMTLPRIQDERKTNLFNRANHFRKQNDFDKALSAYESILNEDNTDAEAHWGAMLSRFGIEYVEDPLTHMPKPTCHRVQHDSVLADADYLAALEYAPDSHVRDLYETQAKEISDIQKHILDISAKEPPFDVFICYKESTEGGTRTKDSTIAQDIYYQLTKEDYKVFFARITLEDKLGQEYEPYIFAALNSAKVMLVIGTKPEYFKAVWVKNEWARYLALTKKDRSLLLIPCYKDMDAYDLPEELSFLQSQDMSKVGFIQDIIRGIRKVLDATKPQATSGGETAASDTGVEPLLKRANIYLEDKDFDAAERYFERALDVDPELPQAYIGKLCINLQLRFEEDLAKTNKPLTEYPQFNRALKYAKGDLLKKYNSYNQKIVDRIEAEKQRIAREKEEERLKIEREKREQEERLEQMRRKIEEEKDEKQYIYATMQMEKEYDNFATPSSINSLILNFRTIKHYKVVPQIIERLNNHKQQLEAKEKEQQERFRYQQSMKAEWKTKGLCKYCGGKIKSFTHVCAKCGKQN